MMTSDSSPPTGQPPALPPAIIRVRSTGSPREAAPSGAADDAVAPIPPLIGEGPRQYLLGWEDHTSFDRLKAAIDEDLQPTGPIERMWVDEIVDLEWDLHRLRRTRRTIVERALVERLTQRTHTVVMATATSSPASELAAAGELSDRERHSFNEEEPYRFEDDEAPSLAQIRYQALKCVRGDRHGREFILHWLVRLDMDDEVLAAQADSVELLARLETSIHATSRLRDGIVSRLYIRRDFIEPRRVASGGEQ